MVSTGSHTMYIFWPPSLLFCWCAGLAFGTGSAVAHRAVDAMLGPRVIHHETVASPAPAAASAPSMTSSEARNACGNHSKALQDVSFLYQCFGISFSWCAWSWPDYILLYGPTFDNDLFSICARRYLFFLHLFSLSHFLWSKSWRSGMPSKAFPWPICNLYYYT